MCLKQEHQEHKSRNYLKKKKTQTQIIYPKKKKKIDIGKHPARLKPSKKPVYLYNNIEEEEDNRFLYIYFLI